MPMSEAQRLPLAVVRARLREASGLRCTRAAVLEARQQAEAWLAALGRTTGSVARSRGVKTIDAQDLMVARMRGIHP
mgnify:CR=1 FL=1